MSQKKKQAKKRKVCNHYFCRGNKEAVKKNVCLYKKLGWL